MRPGSLAGRRRQTAGAAGTWPWRAKAGASAKPRARSAEGRTAARAWRATWAGTCGVHGPSRAARTILGARWVSTGVRATLSGAAAGASAIKNGSSALYGAWRLRCARRRCRLNGWGRRGRSSVDRPRTSLRHDYAAYRRSRRRRRSFGRNGHGLNRRRGSDRGRGRFGSHRRRWRLRRFRLRRRRYNHRRWCRCYWTHRTSSRGPDFRTRKRRTGDDGACGRLGRDRWGRRRRRNHDARFLTRLRNNATRRGWWWSRRTLPLPTQIGTSLAGRKLAGRLRR